MGEAAIPVWLRNDKTSGSRHYIKDLLLGQLFADFRIIIIIVEDVKDLFSILWLFLMLELLTGRPAP